MKPEERVYCIYARANARSLIKIGIKSGTVEKMVFPRSEVLSDRQLSRRRGNSIWETPFRQIASRRDRRGLTVEIGMIRSPCEHISDPSLAIQSLLRPFKFLGLASQFKKIVTKHSGRERGTASRSAFPSFAIPYRVVFVEVYYIILRICTRSAKCIFMISISFSE